MIFFRTPHLWTAPRFWAEEGQVFFSFAFSHPWHEALLISRFGYFSLINNLAAVSAVHLVPLRWAPLMTTSFALLFVILPIALVLQSKAELFKSHFRKVIGILIILLTPPSEEIWLNSINTQSYAALIVFLILIEGVSTESRKLWFHRTLLAICGLTGPNAAILSPLFIFRAVREKTREARIQAGILLTCTALQFAILITTGAHTLQVTDRFASGMDWVIFLSVVMAKDFLLPFFGHFYSDQFGVLFSKLQQLGPFPYWALGLGLMILLTTCFFGLTRKLKRSDQILYFGSFLILLSSSIILSRGDKTTYINSFGGGRYFYTPNVILFLLIFRNSLPILSRSSFPMKCEKTHALVCMLLLGVALSLASIHYREYQATGAPWRQEAEKWAQDPTYQPAIWPYPWRMSLSQ